MINLAHIDKWNIQIKNNYFLYSILFKGAINIPFLFQMNKKHIL
jgi:hypothetical protein